jgi:hypothetical protein
MTGSRETLDERSVFWSTTSLIGSPSSGRAAGTQGTPPRVARLRASRAFIVRGSKRVRAAILTFRLPSRSLVVFEVRRLAPSCTSFGTFRVRGHAGKNRVRFAGRVRGRLLPAGTYELRARGLPNVRVRVAILPRGSSPSDAAAALRAPSTCPSIETTTVLAGAGTLVRGEGAPDGAPPGGVASASSGSSESEESLGSATEGRSRPSAGGALGAIARGARDAGPLGLGLILAGICAAILLLATASLPQTAARGPWLTALVADRRLEIALAGLATLVVVTLAYLISVS